MQRITLALSLLIISALSIGCASLEDRCLEKTTRRGVDSDLRREYYRQCVENGRARAKAWNTATRDDREDD